jgi:hypothetical protein
VIQAGKDDASNLTPVDEKRWLKTSHDASQVMAPKNSSKWEMV